MSESFLNGRVEMHCGDCLDVLATLAENSIDSCVTDPPYHLTSIVKRFGGTTQEREQFATTNKHTGYRSLSGGFMGKQWDGGDIAFDPATWVEVLRVLRPGAHLLAFGGTRTSHRMVCAIEDAGFEIRDSIMWVYGTGFPKSHDVSKGIDQAAGAERQIVGEWNMPGRGKRSEEQKYGLTNDSGNITAPATDAARQWEGWGTALKPACEPIVLARKPLSEKTVAANVLKWGCGALNIGACRVQTDESLNGGAYSNGMKQADNASSYYTGTTAGKFEQPSGRWPANVVHDGSAEVLAAFPETGISSGGKGEASQRTALAGHVYGEYSGATLGQNAGGLGDSGSAARFFYTAKADASDRCGSDHPTIKPLDLMQYLVRLITPPKGTVLDCFSGTGTTGEAAFRESFSAVLIEREAEYQADIRRRMKLIMSGPDERARESIKQRMKDKPADHGPLFEAAE